MVPAGGDRDVTTENVWQSRAQARDRWAVDAERVIWAASTVIFYPAGSVTRRSE
jgi:hypothetical protein